MLLALLLALLVAALAVGAPQPVTEKPGEPAERPDAPPAPERQLSPMMVEITALLEAEKLAVEERRLEMSQTTDMARRLELMTEIHQLKMDTELEILRVQLRHARQAGRLDTVAEIEQAIEFMTNPRPVPAPAPRPVPAADRR